MPCTQHKLFRFPIPYWLLFNLFREKSQVICNCHSFAHFQFPGRFYRLNGSDYKLYAMNSTQVRNYIAERKTLNFNNIQIER